MDGRLRMRTINGKFLLALLVITTVLTGTVFAVDHLPYAPLAQRVLRQAHRAEEQGQPDRVARYLQRYLEFIPRDHAAKERLARLWAGDAFAANHKARVGAVRLLDEVVNYQDNPDARRLLVRLALEVRDTQRA